MSMPVNLTKFPTPKTMTRAEAEAYLGRPTVVAALEAGTLRACCHPNHKEVFYTLAPPSGSRR